jgi:hypothetical protein
MLVAVIIFCSVWFLLKKIIKSIFFKKPKPVQTDQFRFSFLGQKPVQTGLARFFQFGSVRFFRFQAYKTKTEPIGFFKILIGFFYGSVFLIILF